jgi:hypothetical protein
MTFDIADGRADKLDDGCFLHLTNAKNIPLYADDGEKKVAIGVVLRSRNSRVGLATARANGNKRLEIARKQGSFSTSVEVNETETTEMLVSLTVSWTFDTYEGRDFPCTPDNARTFWSDDKNVRWRRDAEDFISSEANFIGA